MEGAVFERTKFQSLFCWMLFWKKKQAAQIKIKSMCFNPYSVGCCSGSSHGCLSACHGAAVSILILLDVVLEVQVRVSPTKILFCFNPYSVGCCSGSLVAWTAPKVLWGFNPYSVGCCSGREGEVDGKTGRRGFQSLFCWMLFWKS